MAKRRVGSRPPPPDDLYQLLLFPERAEYLEQSQFGRYQVHLEHWRELSTEFRRAFEAVYVRKSARILLVHGKQGTGKTLFTQRMERDFEQVKGRNVDEEHQNLWIVLAGGDAGNRTVSEQAAKNTDLKRIESRTGWLEKARTFATSNESAMRVFVIDDVHKDVFLREWAGLEIGEYTRLKAEGHVDTVIESVAQRIVEDCRGDFQRSLFVLLSNDEHLLDQLHQQLERSHAGLARKLSLPLPKPELKEKIVRTNTNRLNRWSYWYCLDRGGPEEKRRAHEILTGNRGFKDSFEAIDRAFAGLGSRSGRPANKNLLTLVTLGIDPLTTKSYIDDRELHANESTIGEHVAAWFFRQQWASALSTDDEEYARRAALLESEFALRWVCIDMRAVWWLCTAPSGDPTCDRLVEFMRISPSIADKSQAKKARTKLTEDADASLSTLGDSSAHEAFAARFRDAGQGRSIEYEGALARHFGMELSKGLVTLPSLRPDIKLAEYEPCAVTSATSSDEKAIEAAIRRSCHVIEFTAYLQPDLRGLEDYIRGKVEIYAGLLESV
ncbi:MAG: hypothetical protein KDK70_32080 [Myxococcales bacterium]|nr:hypothetical protein [Myxococcales bacterium]